MKAAIKYENWCNNIDPKYARDLEDLYKVGARVDAWRIFFQSPAIEVLKNLGGYIQWFNKHEHFENFICEFECSEEVATRAISGLMRPGHEYPIFFERNDIYDSRAWCQLPLDCFVVADGFNARTNDDVCQHQVLEYNQMPMLTLGIKVKQWTVSRTDFTFSHKLKNGERFAQISFNHHQLRPNFKGRRWCADGIFERSATRQQMEAALFAKVREKCKRHHVEILDGHK